jgi:hypothetical protein
MFWMFYKTYFKSLFSSNCFETPFLPKPFSSFLVFLEESARRRITTATADQRGEEEQKSVQLGPAT